MRIKLLIHPCLLIFCFVFVYDLQSQEIAEGASTVKDSLLDFRDEWLLIVNKFSTEGYSILSDEEKTWFDVEILITSIENGGFISYFCNPDGEYWQEAIKSLEKIGANNTKILLEKIVKLFPYNLPPKDMNDRNMIIDSWPIKVNDYLEEIDEEYFKQSENVEDLLVKYINESLIRK